METVPLQDDEGPVLYIFKVVIVGEPNAGKSSMVLRYAKNKFDIDRKPTKSCDFTAVEFDWDPKTKIRLHLWDVAGQERIGTQSDMYFRDTHGVFVVYDTTDIESRIMVTQWKMLLEQKVTLEAQEYKPPCILLCNKIDLVVDNSRDFDTKEAERVCMENKFDTFFPTSNLLDYNVGPAVQQLCRYMLAEAQRREHRVKDTNIVKLYDHTVEQPTDDGGVVITDAPPRRTCGC